MERGEGRGLRVEDVSHHVFDPLGAAKLGKGGGARALTGPFSGRGKLASRVRRRWADTGGEMVVVIRSANFGRGVDGRDNRGRGDPTFVRLRFLPAGRVGRPVCI